MSDGRTLTGQEAGLTEGMSDRARTNAVLREVAMERSVQRGRWGDRHDDTHSRADWNVILSAYTGYVHDTVLEMGRITPSEEAKLRAIDDYGLTLTLRAQLVKVAATLVAWAEAIDRREARHAMESE